MKTFNNLLVELPINPIYKDFKKSIAKPIQLPLPYEFSDEFFTSKKEQMDHALRTMHGMMIGYEFEIYLPGEESEPEYDLDYENPIYETESFTNIHNDYMSSLNNYFGENYNRRSYKELNEEYESWKKKSIDDDAQEHAERVAKMRMSNKNKDLYDPKNGKEYLEEYERARNDFISNLSEYDYSFDDYVNANFDPRNDNELVYDGILLNLIHHFGFESGDYGFDENGYLVVDVDYPEIEVNSDNHTENHKSLGTFLEDKLENVSVKVLSSYHAVKKNTRTWYIEPDGSLHDCPSEYFPVEVSTKPYPATQFKNLFLNTLNWFTEFASPQKPVTNDSTGLHFSISFSDNRPIDFLKLVVLGQDTFWLKRVGRQFNAYCRSQFQLVRDFIERNNKDLGVSKSTVQEIIDDANEGVLDPHNSTTYGLDVSSKMMSINFSKYKELGYIEFRLAGNDYYRNQKRHLEMIEWFLRILVAAATPNLFKEEYHNWLIYEFNRH
jgi:hypothetical protein